MVYMEKSEQREQKENQVDTVESRSNRWCLLHKARYSNNTNMYSSKCDQSPKKVKSGSVIKWKGGEEAGPVLVLVTKG